MDTHHISLTVNGQKVEADVEPRLLLVHFIREVLNLTGTHIGCDTSQCGCCTVHVNGRAMRSCAVPLKAVVGDEIRTIEGLGGDHPVQQAWLEEQVPQCGYCQAGQIMQAVALLQKTPRPTDEQIRQGMNGVLCRCGTYPRIEAAVRRAADALATKAGG